MVVSHCSPPKCQYLEEKNKCIKPNPYVEMVSWCSRNNLKFNNCVQDYYNNRDKHKNVACDRYYERVQHVKPARKQTAKDNAVKMRKRRLEKIANREMPRSSSGQHAFIKDIYHDAKVKSSLQKQERQSLQKSSKSSKYRKLLEKNKAKQIQKFLKRNLLVKYFSLENRVRYYMYVVKFLKDVNTFSCIKPKTFATKTGSTVNGYTIENIIDLERRIGTDSVNGVIYKTSVKNMLGRSPMVAKLMQKYDTGNKNEVEINKKVSANIISRKLSRHFLFTYKVFECTNWLDNKDTPSLIRNEEYFVCLNELAHGDLVGLCENRMFLENDEIVINVACQSLLAIATFHKMGLVHQDTHWGNFLYQLIENKKGYYHYLINGKNYYLKSCCYNVMIYDFGNAVTYNARQKLKANEDYRKILEAFQNNKIGRAKWVKFSNLPTDGVSNYIRDLVSKIFRMMSNDEDHVIDEILKHFMNAPVEVLVQDLPQNQTILNDKPFIIDSRLQKFYDDEFG